MGVTEHDRRRAQQQARKMLGDAVPDASPLVRRVLTELLARTAERWHFLAATSADRPCADGVLVGASGVFAVVVVDAPPDETTARTVARRIEERCAGITGPRGLRLAGSAVHHVVVTPGGGSAARGHSYELLTEVDLPTLFRGRERRFGAKLASQIADQLAERLPDYQRMSVSKPEPAAESAELLDSAELTASQLEAAQRRPFETWMTFLHPAQHDIVARRYGGPARISGPAGTGKTVVALHRLRDLARRSVNPLLFTTFVRTLPKVHEVFFRQLAPEVADRVEFTNLHAWILDFLATRGINVTIQQGKLDDAFSRAWQVHRDSLSEIEPAPHYWQTEIDRVIKGRGLTDVGDYVRVSRRGRSLRLDDGQRRRAWQLYETYQDNLHHKNLSDYNDLVTMATAELAVRPPDKPYAAVVVDEVQDITLVGLRMLRELAGDGPDRLLLVGDGQQQVYSGGWRLSDAGIPVQGRGAVLKVNYRNRASVMDFALRFDATNEVDDLDGAAGVALRQAECVNTGGDVRSWRGPVGDLPAALADAVAGLPVPLGQTALLVFQRKDVDHCATILRRAGVPYLTLEHYNGETDDRLKIGTVHRAKGLDFQAVLALQVTNGAQSLEPAVRERQYLVAATRARDYLWWGVAEAR
jgi:superfamily I DNA/RNA helicase